MKPCELVMRNWALAVGVWPVGAHPNRTLDAYVPEAVLRPVEPARTMRYTLYFAFEACALQNEIAKVFAGHVAL